MAKAWETWLPDLLPHLPGCPVLIVIHELRRAAQAFFARTRSWNITLDAVPVIAGTTELIIVPADTTIDLVRVSELWYDGKQIYLETADTMAGLYGDNWQLHTGTPSRFIQETPGQVRLYPIPETDATSGLVARIAAMPSDTAIEIADNIAVLYQDELTIGAKSRLMLYPGKPWSNPDLGIKNQNDFNAAIDKARNDASMGFGRARVASKPKWC